MEFNNENYRGTETILVVDDEEQIREIFTEVLSSYGYKVITAVDGQDAVEQYRLNHDNINLTIMDVDMPNKNGFAAFKDIIEINSDALVIITSGINKEQISTYYNLSFLQKPLKSIDIVKTIRYKLDTKK